MEVVRTWHVGVADLELMPADLQSRQILEDRLLLADELLVRRVKASEKGASVAPTDGMAPAVRQCIQLVGGLFEHGHVAGVLRCRRGWRGGPARTLVAVPQEVGARGGGQGEHDYHRDADHLRATPPPSPLRRCDGWGTRQGCLIALSNCGDHGILHRT
jgi:hypothetical protein